MSAERISNEDRAQGFFEDSVKTIHADALAAKDSVLIMLMSGIEDGGKRATLALSAACSALAMDKDVSIFLVGDGAYWADIRNTDGVEVPGFPPIEILLESFQELGGNITICSTCASSSAVCGLDEQKKLMSLELREGIEIQGFASVIDVAQRSANLTF